MNSNSKYLFFKSGINLITIETGLSWNLAPLFLGKRYSGNTYGYE